MQNGNERVTLSDDSLIEGINEAAGYCRTLWAALLAYMGAVFILASGTTHRDLLLEAPVKMPLFELGVPLMLFYIIAPTLLVLFHFNFLLKLNDLRVRVRTLTEGRPDGARAALRMRIVAFDYALIAGEMLKERTERNLLGAMTNTTIFLIPVALLLFLQLRFLPYHSAGATWLYRLLVALDLALIFLIQIGLGKSKDRPARRLPSLKTLARALPAVTVLAASIFVFAFPGEKQDYFWRAVWWATASLPPPYEPAYDPVAGQDQAEAVGISRSLYLSGQTLWAKEPSEESLKALRSGKLDSLIYRMDTRATGVDLRRDLEVLRDSGVDLRGRDLSHINLDNASLAFAKLSPDQTEQQIGSRDCTVSKTKPRNTTNLHNASLHAADLRGSDMRYVQAEKTVLEDTTLSGADLTGADLRAARGFDANLRGAVLNCAALDGAVFTAAKMEGARFDHASLVGADLELASLQAAEFVDANLMAAQLTSARMDTANLRVARLEAAELFGAHLNGANLMGTKLTGADLRGASLRGADLSGAGIRGADFFDADITFDELFSASFAKVDLPSDSNQTVATMVSDETGRAAAEKRVASARQRLHGDSTGLKDAKGNPIQFDERNIGELGANPDIVISRSSDFEEKRAAELVALPCLDFDTSGINFGPDVPRMEPIVARMMAASLFAQARSYGPEALYPAMTRAKCFLDKLDPDSADWLTNHVKPPEQP